MVPLERGPDYSEERQAINEQLLDIFYRWSRHEQEREDRGEEAIKVIDFDLVQRSSDFPGILSREETRDALESALREIQQSPQREAMALLEARVKASVYLLRALLGEEIPFAEYIERTMGIIPFYIPDREIERQRGLASEAINRLGYSYDQEGTARLRTENRLAPGEVAAAFTTFKNQAIPSFQSWLGLDVPLEYRMESYDEEKYVSGSVSTDREGKILLRFNTNEAIYWFKGRNEHMVFHELMAHAIQLLSWRQSIRQDRLDPFVGLTSLFTPEQFSLEGVAGTLDSFYPQNSLSDYGRYVQHAIVLFNFVWANAHLMVNEGTSIEEGVRYILDNIPSQPADVLRKDLGRATKEPLFRAYYYVYGPSIVYHKRLAETLSPKEKREFLLNVYQNVYTPSELFARYPITH